MWSAQCRTEQVLTRQVCLARRVQAAAGLVLCTLVAEPQAATVLQCLQGAAGAHLRASTHAWVYCSIRTCTQSQQWCSDCVTLWQLLSTTGEAPCMIPGWESWQSVACHCGRPFSCAYHSSSSSSASPLLPCPCRLTLTCQQMGTCCHHRGWLTQSAPGCRCTAETPCTAGTAASVRHAAASAQQHSGCRRLHGGSGIIVLRSSRIIR
jgi:hypothetical protein